MFAVTKIEHVTGLEPHALDGFYIVEYDREHKVTDSLGPYSSFREAFTSYWCYTAYGQWFQFDYPTFLDYTAHIEYLPRLHTNLYLTIDYFYTTIGNDWIVYNRKTLAVVWRSVAWHCADVPWLVANRLNYN